MPAPPARSPTWAERVRRLLSAELERAEGRLLVARVYIVGRSPAHAELAREPVRASSEIQRYASELEGGDVWIESVRVGTEPPQDLSALAARDDAVGQLLRRCTKWSASPGSSGSSSTSSPASSARFRTSSGSARWASTPEDEASRRELLAGVSRLLLPRLLGEL